MTTVYSRPQTASDLTLKDDVQAPRANDSDFDLIDIIKLSTTNLNTNNKRPKETKQNSLVQFVIKTAKLLRNQYSVHIVNTRFIENTMLHLSENIVDYQMMMFLFNVCFAS